MSRYSFGLFASVSRNDLSLQSFPVRNSLRSSGFGHAGNNSYTPRARGMAVNNDGRMSTMKGERFARIEFGDFRNFGFVFGP